MKNYKKFLWLLLLTFIFNINVVKAACTYNSRPQSPAEYSYDIGIGYDYGVYTLDINGTTPAYCMDPNTYEGSGVYSCAGAVYDPSANVKSRAYGRAVLYILENGYNASGAVNDKDRYVATSIALRVVQAYFWDVGVYDNGRGNNGLLKQDRAYFVNLFANELSAKIASATGDKYWANHVALSTTPGSNLANNSNVVGMAKNLVSGALDAAIEERSKESTKNNRISADKGSTILDTTNGEDNIKNYKVTKTYSIKLSGFESNDASAMAAVNCPECSSKNINYKVYLNDTEVSSNNINLLNADTFKANADFIVTLKIVFTASSSTYDCSELNYTVDIKDLRKNTSKNVYVFETYDPDTQRFYVYTYPEEVGDDTDTGVITLRDKLAMCDVSKWSCEETKEYCEKGNQTACDRFKEVYNSKCANCGTVISSPSCSSTDEGLILEGYEDDDENVCTSPNTSKENILSCIVNSNDAAGHSLTATELVGSNNKYCSVSCKEEYHFSLPGNKEVNSGREFNLNSRINGKKSCYTSKIDNTTFNDDYENAREEVIKAYNSWAMYNSALVSGGSLWSFTAYDPTSKEGSTLTKPAELESVDNVACSYRNGLMNCSYTGDNIKNIINEDTVKGKSGLLAQAINTFENDVIGAYQRCTNWTNDMKYDLNPTVTYDYEEEYMDIISSNKLTPHKTEASESTKNISKCVGVVDDYYRCSSNGTERVETLKPFTCHKDENGTDYVCNTNSTYNISNVSYVSASITSEVNYTLPKNIICNVHTTASIVSGITPEECSKLNGTMIDGLPVGLGTNQGIYDYSLSISNLGEYYDGSNKKGRIWGDEDSVYATVYKELEKNNCPLTGGFKLDSKTGEYVCKYSVNCPDCDNTCRKGNGKYYCLDGNECSEEEYNKQCDNNDLDKYKCAEKGKYDDHWHCADGKVCSPDTEEQYNKECDDLNKFKCAEKGKYDDHWHCADGKICSPDTEEQYKQECDDLNKFKCAEKGKYDDHWHCADGKVCSPDTEEQYNKECDICPDCPIICEPDGCYKEHPDCPNNKCPVECDKCIYNKELNLNYRPVNPENINPNDRDLGANWKFDSNNISTALELKAYVTTEEVKNNGQDIYDVDLDDPNKDFAMTVVLDSKAFNIIKDYNREWKDKGGYLNNSLTCYDHTGKDETGTEETYGKVYCYSELLDKLFDSNVNIKTNKNRLRTAEERENSQDSGYWTSWDKASWSITTTHGISYYKQNYKEIGIGPSWK